VLADDKAGITEIVTAMEFPKQSEIKHGKSELVSPLMKK
jgi:di/tripeptidase